MAISTEAVEAFETYDWPGNVRELENTLKRSVSQAEGSLILLEYLPPEISKTPTSSSGKK